MDLREPYIFTVHQSSTTTKVHRYLLIISILFFALASHAQSLNIEIAQDYFQVDEEHQLILCHKMDLSEFSDLSKYNQLSIELAEQSFTFVNIPTRIAHKDHYEVANVDKTYSLYFTQLPIISINVDGKILDEPKRPAGFTYTDNEQVLKSYVGIELRGGSSISFPKNTFDLEFWEDSSGDDSRDVQFGDLRADDDWILDGLYNEPMRMRSHFSHKLWLVIHPPYYIDQEEDAKSGVDVMYVEMFLNNEYNGVYLLSEQIDKKLLQLKSFKESPRGVLYKGESVGATTFTALPGYNNESREWESYVIKYPKEDQWKGWQELYEFTAFVMDKSNTSFQDSIWSKFNYNNYLDYFIYLNLLRMTDNTGKNIYLAKYDKDEPYFYIPWDLDGSIGLLWDGTYLPTTEGILTNGMHDRIIASNPNRYNRVIRNRWEDLRLTTLSNQTLLDRLQSTYKSLDDNNVYHREAIVHGNYNFGDEAIDYMEDWIVARLDYLDRYFADRTTPTTELNLSTISVFPNPASDVIYVLTDIRNANYKIIDHQGRVVKTGVLNRYNSVNIAALSSGTYFILLNNSIGKIIKQ